MEAGRIRALIIEDNQDITANLYAFLEPLGYELDCSANGHIGLEMAVAGTFDVIVLESNYFLLSCYLSITDYSD